MLHTSSIPFALWKKMICLYWSGQICGWLSSPTTNCNQKTTWNIVKQSMTTPWKLWVSALCVHTIIYSMNIYGKIICSKHKCKNNVHMRASTNWVLCSKKWWGNFWWTSVFAKKTYCDPQFTVQSFWWFRFMKPAYAFKISNLLLKANHLSPTIKNLCITILNSKEKLKVKSQWNIVTNWTCSIHFGRGYQNEFQKNNKYSKTISVSQARPPASPNWGSPVAFVSQPSPVVPRVAVVLPGAQPSAQTAGETPPGGIPWNPLENQENPIALWGISPGNPWGRLHGIFKVLRKRYKTFTTQRGPATSRILLLHLAWKYKPAQPIGNHQLWPCPLRLVSNFVRHSISENDGKWWSNQLFEWKIIKLMGWFVLFFVVK